MTVFGVSLGHGKAISYPDGPIISCDLSPWCGILMAEKSIWLIFVHF